MKVYMVRKSYYDETKPAGQRYEIKYLENWQKETKTPIWADSSVSGKLFTETELDIAIKIVKIINDSVGKYGGYASVDVCDFDPMYVNNHYSRKVKVNA